ncbi:tetratricopeptide repeat protein [Horticoccus sp. 23ND18S-11]|uniref:tetratricopeptide repeat protein n=1 Tax=Horticoccus sp. 23ND18S-11 TaxID=3391832 RepID=UPI0039C9765C
MISPRPPRFPRLSTTLFVSLALLGAAVTRGSTPAPAHGPVEAPPVPKPVETPVPVVAGPTAAEKATTFAATTRAAKATSRNALIRLASTLTERGDYDAAEVAYRQILNNPTVPETDVKSALLGMAHMYRTKGELTKAAAIYERFLAEYATDDRAPDALLSLGRTLRSLGVHKLAIARFYSVINSTLKVAGDGFERYQVLAKTAQFEIAETHFQSGNFVEANKFFTRLSLLDLAPADRARAQFKAGYALRLQGEHEKSIGMLRNFLEQWPQDENVPEARYLLATTLMDLKRPQEAFAATLDLLRTEKSRIAADPKRWAYWQRKTGNQLANGFFETGDTMNARAIYAGLLELSAEPTWQLPLTYHLALCYERLGVMDSARTAYQTIVDAVAAKPSPDFTELATMAKWRLQHLDWREGVGQKISSLSDSPQSRTAATSTTPPAPPKSATP